MINQKLSLQLNVAPTEGGELSQCSTSLRAVKQWVKSLPLLNVEGTIQPVGTMIKELSTLDASPSTLLGCTEVMSDCVLEILKYLESKYLVKGAEGDSEFMQSIKIAHSINHWVLECYLRVVVHQNSSKKNLIQAVARAMEWLFKLLQRCYYLYIPVPKHVWPRLNTLFLVANEGGFSRKLVEMQTQTGKKVSLRNLYLQSIVLTLINPTQLQHKQLKQLATMCPLLATRVRILPKEGNMDSPALFEVDVIGGKAPQYRSDVKDPPVKGRATWYLDFSLIAAALDSKQDVTEGIDIRIRESVPEDLKHQMLRVWSFLPTRQVERVEANQSVDAIIGLAQNFGMRSGGLNAERFVKLHFQGVAISPDAANEMGSMHHQLYVGKLRNFTEGRGACVHFDVTPPDLVSGELVSVRVKDCWMVGIVRWVKKLSGHSSEFGVEFFSSEAEPCVVRIASDDGHWGRYIPALISLREGLSVGEMSLVTPARQSLSSIGMQLFTLKRIVFLKLSDSVHVTGSVLVSKYSEVSREVLPPLTGTSKAKFSSTQDKSVQPSDSNNPWRWG